MSNSHAEADFSLFVTEPKIPKDFDMCNKNGGHFTTHKIILMKISPVFRDLLEGDQTATSLVLTDVNDNALDLLHFLIYAPKSERHFYLTPDAMLYDIEDFKSAFILISKYFVKLVQTYVLERCQLQGIYFRSGKEFGKLFRYRNTECKIILECIEKTTIESIHKNEDLSLEDLLGFENQMMLKILKKKKVLKAERFAFLATKYAMKKGNDEVKRFLENNIEDKMKIAIFAKLMK